MVRLALSGARDVSRHGGERVAGAEERLWRVLRLLTTPLIPIVFAVFALAAPSAEAAVIRFVGNATYTYSGDAAVLTADQVLSGVGHTWSHTLRLELWALAAPYGGGPFTGYKLAEYTLGRVVANFAIDNVNSGLIPFLPPPPGTWHFVLFVTEYVGGPVDDGYEVDDWINFATPVVIALTPQIGLWWNPDESGSGYALDYRHGVLVVTIYSYTATGAPQWYLASGPLSGNTFTSTVDKYFGGQCISCAYGGRPALLGNDGTITIIFSSPTSATMYLPGGRVTQIQPQAF